MNIELYKCSNDNRVINKTLTDKKELSVELLSEFNYDDLIIRLTNVSEMLGYNYVYVPKLNKYYFVTEVHYRAKNTVILDLHIDVLMTFKDAILKCHGLLNNFTENKYPYSSNYNVPLNSELKTKEYKFNYTFPDDAINVLVVVNDRKDSTT